MALSLTCMSAFEGDWSQDYGKMQPQIINPEANEELLR